MFGEGKHIGPDLTGSNRNNLDYLLENILDPSAVVAADFRASVFALKNGRVITGVAVEQTDRTVSIQTQNELITVERSEIDEMKLTNNSLMPDGLLQPLTDDQVCNLIGYLMATEQAPLSAAKD